VNFAIPALDALPWLAQFMLAAVRPLAMVVLLPQVAAGPLPWRARLALVAAMALFGGFRPGAPTLDPMQIPHEVLAGLVAGLGLAMAFGAAALAGEALAQMIGLGFATLGPMGGGAIPGLFTTLAWVALLSSSALPELFGLMAAGISDPAGSLDLLRIGALGSLLFLWGLKVALPLLAVLLLAQGVVAITTRAAPQLSAMSIGPAALLLAAIMLMPLLFDHLVGRLGMAVASGMAWVE
jgi:flagellar biosynthetic protein FliR